MSNLKFIISSSQLQERLETEKINLSRIQKVGLIFERLFQDFYLSDSSIDKTLEKLVENAQNLGSYSSVDHKHSLQNELLSLKEKYTKTRDSYILYKIFLLAKEIRNSVAKYISNKKSLIKNISRSLKLQHWKARDLRYFYRRIIHFHFKNLSDCSGSDANVMRYSVHHILKTVASNKLKNDTYQQAGFYFCYK